MKEKLLSYILVACFLFSLTSLTVFAVPDVTGNVGDDNGVVTTLATTTAPVTTAPVTTPAPLTTTAPITTLPTTPPVTTVTPTTTVPGDMAENGGRVLGIVMAVLIALAVIVLAILLIPRVRKDRGNR